MGDIFWDYDKSRDASLGFIDPAQVAVEAVTNMLREVASGIEPGTTCTNAIRLEYRELIGRLGSGADDRQVISALVSESAWTESGALVVLQLAKDYGTSILRNALALAEAMDIEDGEAGF